MRYLRKIHGRAMLWGKKKLWMAITIHWNEHFNSIFPNILKSFWSLLRRYHGEILLPLHLPYVTIEWVLCCCLSRSIIVFFWSFEHSKCVYSSISHNNIPWELVRNVDYKPLPQTYRFKSYILTWFLFHCKSPLDYNSPLFLLCWIQREARGSDA